MRSWQCVFYCFAGEWWDYDPYEFISISETYGLDLGDYTVEEIELMLFQDCNKTYTQCLGEHLEEMLALKEKCAAMLSIITPVR